jgi:tetratricopeptide (TPR) repeat protein
MPGELLVHEIVAAVLPLVAITLAAIFSVRRYPYALVGWLWFLVTLLPVIGLIKAGEQATADRFAYIPQIGLFIAAAWALRDLCARGRLVAWTAVATALIIIGAAAIATRTQLGHWRNGASLFRRALAVTEDNYVAHLNLGQTLAADGRPAEALEHFTAAIRLRPGWARAHNSYATALAAVGDKDAALEAYEAALRLDPGDPMTHFNRGLLLAERGALDEAINAYSEALQLKPDYVKARLSMAIALASQGQREAAERAYQEALRLDPASVVAHANLGILLEAAGRRDEAIPHYAEAARLAANDPRMHYNLGSALEHAGQRSVAEQHYREALRAAPDFAPARVALDRLLTGTAAPGATP